jgi:hypothetical protein
MWMLGRIDGAADRADAALALAAELDHPFTTAYARFHAGLLRLWRREPQAALDLAVDLLDLADEHDFRIWTAVGTVLLGAAHVEQGRVDAGIAEVRSGIDQYGELRSPPIFWPFLRYVEGRACANAGRAADGLTAVEASIGILGPDDGASILPEMWTLKGDLLLSMASDPARGAADAEPFLQRALDRATELSARTMRLRAATRLARLRVAVGDADGATALLAPILASLTEGFGTADVRDAEALMGAAAPD